jgi:hypothetical protein
MHLDLEKLRANVRAATNEDLLDRATVYREQMEPEALDLIDEELRARDISDEEIAEHAEHRQQTMLWWPDGVPMKCHYCHCPAVAREWRWVWWRGLIPLFPNLLPCCEEHASLADAPPPTAD